MNFEQLLKHECFCCHYGISFQHRHDCKENLFLNYIKAKYTLIKKNKYDESPLFALLMIMKLIDPSMSDIDNNCYSKNQVKDCQYVYDKLIISKHYKYENRFAIYDKYYKQSCKQHCTGCLIESDMFHNCKELNIERMIIYTTKEQYLKYLKQKFDNNQHNTAKVDQLNK